MKITARCQLMADVSLWFELSKNCEIIRLKMNPSTFRIAIFEWLKVELTPLKYFQV